MSDLGDDGPRRRYGVVLFDEVDNPSMGWASVEGATGHQIRSMHDLPGDVLWLTNLNYESFKQNKVELNPSMRMESYLPVKLKDMLAEWGLDPATTSVGMTATFCSQLFQRIMSMSWKILHECNPNIDRMRAFSTNSLRDDLRHLIPAMDFPPEEVWHAFQENQAFKNFTKTNNRSERGAALFMLRRPRLAHVIDVFSSPIPQGPFNHVSSRAMRGGGDRVNWVRTSDKPCLVNVTVLGLLDGVSRDVGDMFAFSNTTNKNDKQQRMWVPHPEFMIMSDFTRMDVLGAWVGQDYSALGPRLPEPVRDFLSSKYSEMSWSAGIVADALLKAAIMGPPADNRRSSSGKDRVQSPRTSWQGAWLRAADRMLMFTNAMSLANDGFSVQSYGMGWVSCSALDTQVRDLMHKGMSIGLVPNFFDVPEDAFKGTIPWSDDRRAAALAAMTVMKQKARLWNVDTLPLYEKERQDERLRKIMQMPS